MCGCVGWVDVDGWVGAWVNCEFMYSVRSIGVYAEVEKGNGGVM